MSDFVGPSYKLGDVQAACQRTVNMYVQRVGTPEKAQFILRAFPGFSATAFADIGASVISQPARLLDFEGSGLTHGQSVQFLYGPGGTGTSGNVEIQGATLYNHLNFDTDYGPVPPGFSMRSASTTTPNITILINPTVTRFNRLGYDRYMPSGGSVMVFGVPISGGAEILLFDSGPYPGGAVLPVVFHTQAPIVFGNPVFGGAANYVINRILFAGVGSGSRVYIDNISLSFVP